MVKSKEEIIKALSEIVAKVEGDEAVTLLEDVTDTLNAQGLSETDVQAQIATAVAEVEKKWREKYIARFADAVEKSDTESDEDENKTDEAESTDFDDLFTE